MTTRTLRLGLALLFGLSSAAAATDGYFANGYGTPCKAMAGACVALHLTALAPATNPAAVAFLGGRYDVTLGYFNPNRDYTVSGSPSGYPGTFGLAPGRVTSGSTGFVIPSLAGAWKIGPASTLGVAFFGNGGMNTDYNAATFGNVRTGVDLSQMFLTPTFATRFGGGKHAFGVSAIVAYQRFRAEGLQAFGNLSQDPSNVSNRGYDHSWGYGGRIGYLGEPTRWLSIGASYQTKVKMQPFEKYAGLFAQGGDFDIPASWSAGFAARPAAPFTVSFEFERIYYSDVRSIGNPFLPNLMLAPLGAPAGAGFCWRDMNIYKIGLEYVLAQDWIVRGGYSYGTQPIPEDDVLINILAPGVIQNHASLGLSHVVGSGRELHLTVVRAFSRSVSGPNALEAPGQQQIRLRMDQWEYELGFAFGF